MANFTVSITLKLGLRSRTVKRTFSAAEVGEIELVRQWLHERSQEAANIARQGSMPRGRGYGTFNTGDR